MRWPPVAPLSTRWFLGILTLVVVLPPRGSLERRCGFPYRVKHGYYSAGDPNFSVGSRVIYYCDSGFKLTGPSTVVCVLQDSFPVWTTPRPSCEPILCQDPPSIDNGYHDGTGSPYAYGKVVTYRCKEPAKLFGKPSIICKDGGLWRPKPPQCKVVTCEDPVVEHGIQLSGFQNSYTYGSSVTFECKIGYFMIGSYLIKCDESNAWSPGIPSCKRITTDICGAPIIPSGSVHPLKTEYEIGTIITVLCNPKYSFPDDTIEMTVKCEGYNLWDPLVQPCILRTLPDRSTLSISNGRVIVGKKKNYEPGDNVTVDCHPGYVLRGSSTIRYIGGKKWVPNIPRCSLSFFFVLLISACVLIVVLLAVKMVCKKTRSGPDK